MDNLVQMRRKHTKWSINQNPRTITINRTERKDVGGYFDETESQEGPFIVRIFSSRSSTSQTITNLAGQKQVDRHFGLLADFEADIKADTHTTDKFIVDGMEFEVKAIYPQSIKEKVVGFQGELERVK